MPMPSKRTLAVLISASLSAGCVVGPDYTRPELSMPEHFQGQAAVDQRHARPNADLIAWWTGFGDPQLTRVVTVALEQNLDLAQAAARVAQLNERIKELNSRLMGGQPGAPAGQAPSGFFKR